MHVHMCVIYLYSYFGFIHTFNIRYFTTFAQVIFTGNILTKHLFFYSTMILCTFYINTHRGVDVF